MAAAQAGIRRRVQVIPKEELAKVQHSEAMVLDYAQYIGIDIEMDRDLIWLARAGLSEPVPDPWWACRTVGSQHMFFFNTETQQSVWEHPCDSKYKKLVQDHLENRLTVALTLTIEQLGSTHRLVATKLSGAQVKVPVPVPHVTSVTDVCETIQKKFDLPEDTVVRFVLNDGTVLSHSKKHLSLAELFGLKCDLDHGESPEWESMQYPLDALQIPKEAVAEDGIVKFPELEMHAIVMMMEGFRSQGLQDSGYSLGPIYAM